MKLYRTPFYIQIALENRKHHVHLLAYEKNCKYTDSFLFL
jgi:hypothetical protein